MSAQGFEKVVQLRCGDKRAKVYARLAPARTAITEQLRHCAQCQSVNVPAKKNCWLCNAPLPEVAADGAGGEKRWQMKLEMERKVYWSTDDGLNESMKQLFADLAAGDFSQSAFQAWLNREKMRLESAKGTVSVSARHMTETASLLFVFRAVTAVVCAGIILWGLYLFWADLRVME